MGVQTAVPRLWIGALDWVTVAFRDAVPVAMVWVISSGGGGLSHLTRCTLRLISSAEILKCYCASIALSAEFNSSHHSGLNFYLDAEAEVSKTVTVRVIDSSVPNGTALAGQCS